MAHILTIDDDVMIRELQEMFLKDRGHTVTTAATGMEGLEKLRKGGFDLVLLDINIGDIDGLDLLRMMRGVPGSQNVPVLMCSAQEKGRTLEEAFALGAVGYVLKPFGEEGLAKSVDKALAARK